MREGRGGVGGSSRQPPKTTRNPLWEFPKLLWDPPKSPWNLLTQFFPQIPLNFPRFSPFSLDSPQGLGGSCRIRSVQGGSDSFRDISVHFRYIRVDFRGVGLSFGVLLVTFEVPTPNTLGTSLKAFISLNFGGAPSKKQSPPSSHPPTKAPPKSLPRPPLLGIGVQGGWEIPRKF